jgi:hypothetical protein
VRQGRLLLLIFLLHFFSASAQQTDSLRPITDSNNVNANTVIDSVNADSLQKIADSLLLNDSAAKAQQDSLLKMAQNKRTDSLNAIKKAKELRDSLKTPIKSFKGQELLFYSLIIMLVFFGMLRLLFPKYFADLIRVYFRTTLKQTQVREQLLQTPLPSLLLNGFFIVSGGMYAAFLLQHFNVAPKFNFWQLWLYSAILLSIIYMMKFAGVWLAGWLFNRSDAASAYTFIIFMNNKIAGIVVLPFLILLAFGTQTIYPAALIVSITIISFLFLYPFYLSVGVMRGQARVGFLHFLLYLSAFEVLPLLILFKWVMSFLK